MRNPKRALVGVLAVAFLLGSVLTPTLAEEQAPGEDEQLQLYQATVDTEQWADIQDLGLDIAHVDQTVDGIELQVVAYPSDQEALGRLGIDFREVRNEDGLTQIQAAEAQSVHGFDVWRSFDEPGGIEDQIRALADDPRNGSFLRLFDLGDSHQGRDILALRLTVGAQNVPVGSRPAVLYQGTTHAREWISTEVTMRLLNEFVDGMRSNDRDIRRILRTSEVWFIPVLNPDGYQYTFDVDRLWRKNLRDNNGDGEIGRGDGVDLNRNYPENWGYDEEGSSSQPASEVYRGPAPASEPETLANIALFDMLPDLQFAVSYHSFGDLLLYSQGWQVQSPSADDPIFVALTGTDDDPAVEGYRPRGRRRPVHHQRRVHRLVARRPWGARLDPRAVRGLPRLRVRVPRRRGTRPGGVRAQPGLCNEHRPLGHPAG